MSYALVKASFRVFFRVRGTVLGPLVFLLIMFSVEGSFWRTVSRAGGGLGGYGTGGLVLYAFTALLISQVTACTGEPDSLSTKVEGGALDAYLLRPLGFLGHMASVQLGTCAARAAALFPLLIGIQIWLGGGVSAAHLAWLLPTLAVGGLLNFLVNGTISNLSFVFRESYAFVIFKETLFWVLSGALIPLDLFPRVVRDALLWFPPAYVVYYPAKVALGAADGAVVLAAATAFLALGAAVFHATFRLGVRRYQAFGG